MLVKLFGQVSGILPYVNLALLKKICLKIIKVSTSFKRNY